MKRRPGIAIVMVLVVLLLVEGMVAGMLALATHTRATAAARVRTMRAEAAADFAAQSVLRQWVARRYDTLPPGSHTVAYAPGTEPDVTWSATIERLQSGFLIRAGSQVGGATTYARANVLASVRVLDRQAVLNELNAGLISAGQVVMAGTTTLSADSLCSAAGVAMLTGLPPILSPTVTVLGAIVVDSSLRWSDSLALGGLRWGEVAAIADRIETGSITPMPVIAAGVCDEAAPANWGDPASAASACAGYLPLIFAPADLTLTGGSGQGLLVVAGVLSMSGNASFDGVVVARDGLTIGPAARISGAVLSRQGYALIDDADIVHSPCTLTRVLAGSRATRRIVPEPRRFLPVF